MHLEINIPFSIAEIFDREAHGCLKELRQASMSVWGDKKLSAGFLCRAHPLLGNKAPVELSAASKDGHEDAMRIVNNLKHGLAA